MNCSLVGRGPSFFGDKGGRDESVRHGAGSQWIVAARPLYHLQCPVAYLSRLQRIQLAIRAELRFEAATRGSSAGEATPATWARGGKCPYCGSGADSEQERRLLAWILT